MVRELARELASFGEFVDWVVVELEFRRGQFETGAEILKAHKSMTLLRASTSEAELLVKLIRPRRAIKSTLGSRIQSSGKIWRVFTASEVLEFAASVGDNNPIHRLNPPIVPALLILESICAAVSVEFIKLKFKNFITVGEPLTLYFGERLEIISAGVRKVTGEFL